MSERLTPEQRDWLERWDGITSTAHGLELLRAALARIDALEGRLIDAQAKLADAMRFVPQPETMSGYCDPHAPDDVKELIALAAKLQGATHDAE